MSMKPHFYVMAGAAIPRELFPSNLWEDEKWQPYLGRHEGVEMAIVEGDNNIYCGRVLGEMDIYQEGGHQMLRPKFDGVVDWLVNELQWQGDIGVLFVCVWQ